MSFNMRIVGVRSTVLMKLNSFFSLMPLFLRRHKIIKFFLWLFPKSNIQIVEYNGSAKLFADISDPNPRNYFIKKKYDPFFFDIATLFLQDGGVFFDVGANFGFCSFGVVSLFNQSKLSCHLFEANPEIFGLIKKSIDLNDNQIIFANHCCVSNHVGTSKIRVMSQQLGMSYIDDEGDYEVENVVLDDYIKAHNLKKVDFLKMDIEGWELYAIQGASESIREGKIGAMYIEVSSKNLNRSKITANKFIEYLKSLGLRVYYCKSRDILKLHLKTSLLRVKSKSIKVAEVDKFPENYQTDLLAIRDNLGYLE